MKNNIPRLAALLVVMALMAASAVPVQSSTSSLVTFRDCVAGMTACDAFTPTVASDIDGNPGDLSSSASLQDNAYGQVQATSQLSGVAGAPDLSASSSSQPGKRLGATSVALQRYTYTGAAAATLTYSGNLSYSAFVPGGNMAVPLNSGVYAQLFLFTTDDPAIDLGNTEQSNFDGLFFGGPIVGTPGFSPLGFAEFSDYATNPAGFMNLSISFDLSPGDDFWAYALMQAISANGATAQGDFVTGFDNASYLMPANTIPEPGSLALLALGLAGFGFASCRRSV